MVLSLLAVFLLFSANFVVSTDHKEFVENFCPEDILTWDEKAETKCKLEDPVAVCPEDHETEKPPLCPEDIKLNPAECLPNAVKPGKCPISFVFGNSILEISGKFRPEGLYGVNLRLLNNDNNKDNPQLDKIFFLRHTIDLWIDYMFGRQSCGYDIVQLCMGLRNRGIWGAEESIIPTTNSYIKHVDAVIGKHNHTIPRHLVWFRELWMELLLNDVFHFGGSLSQRLTMGLFSFKLGRGIALGDAYEVDPDFLGYQSPVGIDQFAPGIKLGGQLMSKDRLTYDLYFELAGNRANTFDAINERIYSQRKGRRNKPQRGFGSFDYIIAAHLIAKPWDRPDLGLSIEPYALFNHQTEEKIEFTGDAKSNLGTFGLAVEGVYGCFEAGFDTAFNVGKQTVYAWDKNVIEEKNNDGVDNFVYSSVRVGSGTGSKALVTSAHRAIVDNSNDFCQSSNGNLILTGESKTPNTSDLYNASNRYNNRYQNTFKGVMFVGDMAYTFIPYYLKFALMGAVSTGDEDPNKDLGGTNTSSIDKDFKGFVTLQELYQGTRVKSVFLLSGFGRVPRLLSIPEDEQAEVFPSQVSRFSNLILGAAGLEWQPHIGQVVIDVRPNALAYWVFHPTSYFPLINGQKAAKSRIADRFLGVELNVITDVKLLQDLKMFVVGALFLPGGFFHDLKKAHIIATDQVLSPSADVTPNEGAPVLKQATLGDSPAYFVQLGFEYRF